MPLVAVVAGSDRDGGGVEVGGLVGAGRVMRADGATRGIVHGTTPVGHIGTDVTKEIITKHFFCQAKRGRMKLL